jgi:branched-subunit amino acid ABC-type transport system permease component
VSQYLPFVVAGVTAAAVYALAAMGLVLLYSTSGIFNFAHGAIGMVAAYLCYSLREQLHWPTALAVAVCVAVVAPLMGVVIDRLLLGRLAGGGTAVEIVVSLGLLVALQGFVIAVYGGNSRPFAGLFPRTTFRLPGVNVGYDQAGVVLIAVAVGVALAVFFRATQLGLQTRAVVEDRDLVALTGTSPRLVTTISWMLGCALAALAAILLAPFVGLDTAVLTLLVVQAFGAAVVGRLTSIGLTVLGATVIGVGASLATKFAAQSAFLAGLPPSLPFIVLFAVLVASPRGRFVEAGGAPQRRSTRPGRTIGRPNAAVGLTALAAAAAVPFFVSGGRMVTATVTVIFVLVFDSLSLLAGTARLVSLCHGLFVGLGATTLVHLVNLGLPYPLALLVAGLVFAAVGALVAIPAIRLSGLFLALATFGFGVLAQNLVYPTVLAFGSKGALSIGEPALFGWTLRSDDAIYAFALGTVAVGVGAIEVVRRTRLGRTLRALGDSPTALTSLGVRTTVPYVMAFCVSSMCAAIAGGLLVMVFKVITSTTFDYFQSLVWLTVLVTAGVATLGGAVTAAVLLVTVPAVWTAHSVLLLQPVAFGLSAIVLAQSRNGLAGLVHRPDLSRLAAAHRWRLERSPAASRREAVPCRGQG